jgi:hypothetical protein
MDFAPVYLVARFLYRIKDFFHHWYVDGSRWWGHRFWNILARADRTLAIKITLIHFFEPLYRDYTVIGRVLGIIFRTGRILIGAVVYLVLGMLFLIIYLLWLLLPIVLIVNALRYL